jgi:hypothetical protein
VHRPSGVAVLRLGDARDVQRAPHRVISVDE